MGSEKEKLGKAFSLAFWLAIPSYFFLGAVFFIALLLLFDKHLFPREIWIAFLFGFLASVAVFGTADCRILRTFVHELKHGAAILLYGGSLKDFKVGTAEGHVEYEISKESLHFVPRIGLAPYCFPLLSCPTLIGALIFESDYRVFFSLLLGLALGADVSLSYAELDPRQTDFKKIAGGFFASAFFIAGVFFFWVSACLLWVCAGRLGFAYATYLAFHLIQQAQNGLRL